MASNFINEHIWGSGGGGGPTTPVPRITTATPASASNKRKRPDDDDDSDELGYEGIDYDDGLPKDKYLQSQRYKTHMKVTTVDRRNELHSFTCLYPLGAHTEQNRFLSIHPDTRYIRSTDCTPQRSITMSNEMACHERRVNRNVHHLAQLYHNFDYMGNHPTTDPDFNVQREHFRQLINYHQLMWQYYNVQYIAVNRGILYRLANPSHHDFVIYVLRRDNVNHLVLERTNSNLDIFDGLPTLPPYITTEPTFRVPTRPQSTSEIPFPPPIPGNPTRPTTLPPLPGNSGETPRGRPEIKRPRIVKLFKDVTTPPPPTNSRHEFKKRNVLDRKKRQDTETNFLFKNATANMTLEEKMNYFISIEPALNLTQYCQPLDLLTFDFKMSFIGDFFNKIEHLEKSQQLQNYYAMVMTIEFVEPTDPQIDISKIKLQTQIQERIQGLKWVYDFATDLLLGWYPRYYNKIATFDAFFMKFLDNLRKPTENHNELKKLSIIAEAKQIFYRLFNIDLPWWHNGVSKNIQELTSNVTLLNNQLM
jgi:hypothetical protein